jgi:hypothetical protein
VALHEGCAALDARPGGLPLAARRERELGCDFVDFRSGVPPGDAPKHVSRFAGAHSAPSFALLGG